MKDITKKIHQVRHLEFNPPLEVELNDDNEGGYILECHKLGLTSYGLNKYDGILNMNDNIYELYLIILVMLLSIINI